MKRLWIMTLIMVGVTSLAQVKGNKKIETRSFNVEDVEVECSVKPFFAL